MGKLILASLVAGAIGALVVYFLLTANHREETRALTDRITTAEKLVEGFGGQLTEARKKVVESERKILAAARDAAMASAAADDAKAAAAAANAAVTGGAAATADGSPLVTAEQVEEILDRRLGARGAAPGEPLPAPPPVTIPTLSELAAQMNLTASEEARLRDTIKTMEEDMVKSIFGDRPIGEIAQEIREAKDDPDKQEALVNQVISGGLANLGRFATYETRRRKKVEEILGKDRAKEFLSRPIRPVIDVDLDELFGD